MIGFPFDSHVSYDGGVPSYDRAVSSQPLRELFSNMFSTGVLELPDNNLQVFAGQGGQTVVVHSGFALIKGGMCLESEDRTLEVTAPSTLYDRIDTVVVRWNENDDVRTADLYVLEGTPSANPVRPELTRTNSIYELGLADIFVTRGVATITQDKITDTRGETERCGYMTAHNPWTQDTLTALINALCLQKINDLDAQSVGGTGKVISQINEVNGVINAVATDLSQAPTQNLNTPISSKAVYTALTGKQNNLVRGNVSLDPTSEYGLNNLFGQEYTGVWWLDSNNGEGSGSEMPWDEEGMDAPHTRYWWIIVMGSVQIAVPYMSSGREINLRARYYANSQWYSWKTFNDAKTQKKVKALGSYKNPTIGFLGRVPNATNVKVGEIEIGGSDFSSLEAGTLDGTWIAEVIVQFSQNANGYRGVSLAQSYSSTAMQVQYAPSPNTTARVQITKIFRLSNVPVSGSGIKIGIFVRQNSGSTLDCDVIEARATFVGKGVSVS